MVTLLRQSVFLFVALILRWPLWLLLGIAGKFGVFKFVFLVYPHDEKECESICPNIPIIRRFLSGRPTFGGLIAKGLRPIGIYFVVPDLPRELARKKNRHVAENIINRMRWIQRLTGTTTIGLAGQLGPILARRHNIPIEPPFFSSINGNIFSIYEALKWVGGQKIIPSKQRNISIIGGGELGEALNGFLTKQGMQSEIIDVRFTRHGNALPITSDQSIESLKQTDFVINLLPKGNDFMQSNLPNIINEKTSIIDFSRPAIDKESISQKVYMGNRLQKSGMRFVLALPGGWSQKQLPACALPAMLASMAGEINEKLESFCMYASRQEFSTALASATSMRLSSINNNEVAVVTL